MLMNDIRYGCRALIKSVIIFICLLAVPVAVTMVLQGATGKIREWVSVWPPELWALCGATDMNSKILNIMPFYMLIIIINMVAMCRCASASTASMVADMENGRLKNYINQPYSRDELFFMKLAVAVGWALVQWLVYCGVMAVAVCVLCGMLNIQAGPELSGVLSVAVRGMIFVIFLMSICLLYNMNRERRMTNGSFFTIVCSVSLMGGNGYKVLELIGYYVRRLQGDDSAIAFASEIGRVFRNIFPFTLLNVLNTEKEPLVEGVYFIYFFSALVAFALCRYIYGKKNFA